MLHQNATRSIVSLDLSRIFKIGYYAFHLVFVMHHDGIAAAVAINLQHQHPDKKFARGSGFNFIGQLGQAIANADHNTNPDHLICRTYNADDYSLAELKLVRLDKKCICMYC